MAERTESAVRQPGHHLGQLVERRCAGEQYVEGRIPEQVQCERAPLGPGTPSAPRRRGSTSRWAREQPDLGDRRRADRHRLEHPVELLASASRLFAEKCVDGIEAQRENAQRYAGDGEFRHQSNTWPNGV